MDESQVWIKAIFSILGFFFILLNTWLLLALNRLDKLILELTKVFNDHKVHLAENYVPLDRFRRLEEKVDALHQWRRE